MQTQRVRLNFDGLCHLLLTKYKGGKVISTACCDVQFPRPDPDGMVRPRAFILLSFLVLGKNNTIALLLEGCTASTAGPPFPAPKDGNGQDIAAHAAAANIYGRTLFKCLLKFLVDMGLPVDQIGAMSQFNDGVIMDDEFFVGPQGAKFIAQFNAEVAKIMAENKARVDATKTTEASNAQDAPDLQVSLPPTDASDEPAPPPACGCEQPDCPEGAHAQGRAD